MATPTGLDRRELWIDARDLQSETDDGGTLTPEEYSALLTSRGLTRLAQNQLVQSFAAVVRTRNPTYQYGVDFQLGDTITATDDRLGISADAVVEGVMHSVSQSGEVMELQMGYGQPTIFDIINRKAEK